MPLDNLPSWVHRPGGPISGVTMRRVATLSLLTLAACATGSSTTSTRPESMRVIGSGGSQSFNLTPSTSANVSRVSGPIDKVWRLMPAVYDSLKIPLTRFDAAQHIVGNEGMKAHQKLGTVSLSKYIDCGEAQIGPSADTYDVYLSVVTTVRTVSPTETEIQTMVESAAKPMSFGQEYARCSSKGTIETAISNIVSARLSTAK